jgi:hypothetical protein
VKQGSHILPTSPSAYYQGLPNLKAHPSQEAEMRLAMKEAFAFSLQLALQNLEKLEM